jgi:predicted transcriptional regulator
MHSVFTNILFSVSNRTVFITRTVNGAVGLFLAKSTGLYLAAPSDSSVYQAWDSEQVQVTFRPDINVY